MKEEHIKALNEIGISKNEAEVYFALLELGSAPVSDIALKANVHRVNIYDAIKRLQEKGLVASVIKDEKNYFEPAPPSEIERLIAQKEQKIAEMKKEIPKLFAVYNQEKSKQEVHHYIGKKGLITAYNNMLKIIPEKGNFFSIGSTGIMRDVLPVYTKLFVRKKEENKLVPRILYYHSARNVKKFKNMNIRYIPKGMEFIPMTIYLFENHVTIMSFEPMLAIEINSKQIYDNYMKYGEWLWSISEE